MWTVETYYSLIRAIQQIPIDPKAAFPMVSCPAVHYTLIHAVHTTVVSLDEGGGKGRTAECHHCEYTK